MSFCIFIGLFEFVDDLNYGDDNSDPGDEIDEVPDDDNEPITLYVHLLFT